METSNQALLSNHDEDHVPEQPLLSEKKRPSLFTAEEGDIEPINGVGDFFREFCVESKKLWHLAGPSIFTSICSYLLGAMTLVFAGQLTTLDLAAVSVENTVIAGFSSGVLLGMGSALTTLCGQAFGAGQLDMLGIYMQRSWVILNTTSLILTLLYIFSQPILKLIGQTDEIAKAAGTFAIWMIPQLFAYSMHVPIGRFLRAQGKIMAMALIALVALIFHVIFSWLLMLKLGWGLVGAAVVLNVSWWFIVIAQMLYIFSGTCGQAWSGFSWKAFQNLWGFVRLSLESAVMLWIAASFGAAGNPLCAQIDELKEAQAITYNKSPELWYYTALILFAGYLKNAEVSVDALSVCMTILVGALMVAAGFNMAISVRISNELGAGHPRTAKFSVVVVLITSCLVGIILSLILIITRKQFPIAFTSSSDVRKLIYELTPLLAISIIINNVQLVLSGVAIGAGWQAIVAYVNIGCYYILGIPLGLLLCFKLNMGIKGIWCGMLFGTVIQTCIVSWITYRTNWNKESSMAKDRIRRFGGDNTGSDIEK